MNPTKLAGLQPANVFYYFEQLCAIPHGSGNTKAISDYLVDFAKAQGLRYQQDALNNVIIFQDGTCGMEDHASVILQGHMDMVCEKDPECPLDMTTQGLDIAHDGQFVFANGTTLGGDDGIALAYALALLADTTIPHPPLEVVITVDEETGMYGAAGIDLSSLQGKTMLNIDSEEEGVFTVACAGGVKSTISLPLPRHPVYGPCVKLTVDGLQGGHSGVEIHKNRANANKVMGMLLDKVQQLFPICITSLQGGAKDNAIPRSCTVTFVALGMYIDRINQVTEELQAQIRKDYDEPDVIIQGDDVDALGGNALSAEDSRKVIALLNAAPNGVRAWSEDMPGLVQTSLNLGIVTLDQQLELTFALRSSVAAQKQAMVDHLQQLAQTFDAQYSQLGDYPAWEYKKESVLRDTMVQVYRNLFGKEPKVVSIHAGLECGLLGEKIPGLDCVSIGPQIHDIHTSRERLDIASTERTWRFLLEVLKSL